jgi:hypothetical protein
MVKDFYPLSITSTYGSPPLYRLNLKKGAMGAIGSDTFFMYRSPRSPYVAGLRAMCERWSDKNGLKYISCLFFLSFPLPYIPI